MGMVDQFNAVDKDAARMVFPAGLRKRFAFPNGNKAVCTFARSHHRATNSGNEFCYNIGAVAEKAYTNGVTAFVRKAYMLADGFREEKLHVVRFQECRSKEGVLFSNW